MPKRGDTFARVSYVPAGGDVVHVDWSPAAAHEMKGPHYGLVLSVDVFNHGTGFVYAVPITSKAGKLSDFELPVRVGRVNGVAILSNLRCLDYQARDVAYEGAVTPHVLAQARETLRSVFE